MMVVTRLKKIATPLDYYGIYIKYQLVPNRETFDHATGYTWCMMIAIQ